MPFSRPSPVGRVLRLGIRGAVFAVLTLLMAALMLRHLTEVGQSVERLARTQLTVAATAASRNVDADFSRFAMLAGQIAPADLRGDRLALTARLLHMQIAQPGTREVFAATAAGRLIAASDPLPDTVPDLSGRGWFVRALAAAPPGPLVSLAAPGWSHPGAALILTVPVRNPAGATVGLIGALVPPEWMHALLAQAPLAPGATLGLLGADRTVLVAAQRGAAPELPVSWAAVPAQLVARVALRGVPAMLAADIALPGTGESVRAAMLREAAWASFWPAMRGDVAGFAFEFLGLWVVFGVLLLSSSLLGRNRAPVSSRSAPRGSASGTAATPGTQATPAPDPARDAERDAALARAASAEAALADSRRALAAVRRDQETALGAIGHDMRTPMQSVLGICDLLLDGALEDDQRRWVEQLHTSGAALLALLNGLLAIAGGGGSQVEATHLADLLEGAASLFTAEAEQHAVIFSVRIDPALAGIWSVDGARLRQIVVNLLANAIARTHSGTVELRAAPEQIDGGQGVRIVVRDTGPGIAAADQARIFGRFEQADAVPSGPHLGLGLSLCRENAAAMGATLTVESALGQGATFTLICPAEPVPPDARRHAFAGRTALIVGLAEGPRAALLVQLEALGFAVEAAPDGYLGLALAERTVARVGVLDVVVLDLAQTAMASESFCLRLRGSGFGRSLALLGLAEDPLADRPAGLDSVMRRGATASEVANAVARLLAEQPAMSALMPSPPGGASVSGGRVLIVEDDETNRALLGAALTRNGFTAFPAATGEEAVRMAEHDGLDAVLVDLALPGIDGLETARRIRALPGRSAIIPIVALTARAGEAVEAECRAAGLTAMVGKPADLDQLAQRLRGWIAAAPRVAASGAGGTETVLSASPVAQISEPFLEAMVSEIGLERTRACLQEFLDEAASKTMRLGELIPGWEAPAMLRLCDDLKGLADLFGAVGFSEVIEELGAATDHGARAEAAQAMNRLEEGLPRLPEAMWAGLAAIERRRAERNRRAA